MPLMTVQQAGGSSLHKAPALVAEEREVANVSQQQGLELSHVESNPETSGMCHCIFVHPLLYLAPQAVDFI